MHLVLTAAHSCQSRVKRLNMSASKRLNMSTSQFDKRMIKLDPAAHCSLPTMIREP